MWELWFLVLIFLLIITIWTSHLLIIALDLSTIMTLFLSLLPIPLTLQFLCLFICFSLSTLIIYLLFPNYHTLLSPSSKSLCQLIGLTGTVSKAIGPGILSSGHIRLDGETWCALSYSNTPIAAGKEVEVKAIKGIHLIVSPLEVHTL